MRLSCDPADHPTAAYIRRNHLDYGVRTDSPGVHLPSPLTEPQPQPSPSPAPGLAPLERAIANCLRGLRNII